jgi:hypothetical protein
MTVNEAIERAGLGYKIFGVVIDGRVVGTEVENASGGLIGFWAVGHKESSPPPLSVSDTSNRRSSLVSSAE